MSLRLGVVLPFDAIPGTAIDDFLDLVHGILRAINHLDPSGIAIPPEDGGAEINTGIAVRTINQIENRSCTHWFPPCAGTASPDTVRR
jgi:hypothetical protein